MFHARIKAHTRDAHAALERKLMQRISRIENRVDYAALLVVLYSYYSSVENAVFPFASEGITDYDKRRKASRLRDDVKTLMPHVESFPSCTVVPTINSFYGALGALYVTEGSTLGGVIISRIISSKLQSQEGFSFFTCYGDNVQVMWNNFKTYLQGPFTTAHEAEILDSARETFLTFNQWLSAHD